jgi:nucleoside-diphosphate-sugar epimerase
MIKVLITGANSFVGTNFRRFSMYTDITEVSLLNKRPEDIKFNKYDVVLHLAAIVHQSKKIPDDTYFKVNRDLSLDVAKLAKKAGIKQFVFLSSLKVYGESVQDSKLRNEGSICLPADAYGRSKYEAEIGLRKLEDANFTVSVIRSPLVYGDGVKANMLSLVKLVNSFSFLPFRNVHNKRNFVYTENLAGFIDRIIEKRASGVFIVKDDDAISTTQLVNYLAINLDRKVTLFKLPKFFILMGRFLFPSAFSRLLGSFEFDNSETKKILDYTPKYSTELGIKKWIDSFKSAKQLNKGHK